MKKICLALLALLTFLLCTACSTNSKQAKSNLSNTTKPDIYVCSAYCRFYKKTGIARELLTEQGQNTQLIWDTITHKCKNLSYNGKYELQKSLSTAESPGDHFITADTANSCAAYIRLNF